MLFVQEKFGECRGGEQKACVARERQEREAAGREMKAREPSVVLFDLSNSDDDPPYPFIASFPLATDLAFGNVSERAKLENFGAAMAAGSLYPGARGYSSESDGLLQQARFALNVKRPQEAQRIAQEILKTDPRHAQALRICGAALLMQDRAADAVAALEEAVHALRDPETDTLLAIAFRRIGRNEDAFSRLKRATKRRPPFGAAFHELGFLLFSMERYNEAIEVLSRGHELLPMMPELSILLGNVFLGCRNFLSAKVHFGRALRISPSSSDAMYGLAMAQWRLYEYQVAADLFRRCVICNPDDVSAWLSLGHCLLELGQCDAGYDCFRTVARGDPRRYGSALTALVNSGRSRFWLKPSTAERFLRGTKS